MGAPWRTITGRARQPKRKPKCAKCGKPRGSALTHVCPGGGDFAARRAREDRRAAAAERRQKERERIAAARAARRAKAARRVADTRRRERQKADARAARLKAKRKPAGRRSRPSHPYQSCRDRECARPACVAYRDGIEYGVELATAAAQ
jgi:hypothetical protein